MGMPDGFGFSIEESTFERDRQRFAGVLNGVNDEDAPDL
jgi:hypothetical protein